MGILTRGTAPAAVVGLVMLLSTAPAHADSRGTKNDPQMRNAARFMADSADMHFRKGDYARALKLFEMAESLYHAPTLVLAIAHTHRKLGELVAAQRRYRQVTREKLGQRSPLAFRRAQAEAKSYLRRMEKAVPTLEINLPEGAQSTDIRVDGKAVPQETIGKPLPLDPGEHYLVATRGNHSRSFELRLKEGDREKVLATVMAGGRETIDPSTELGWLPPTLIGVGAAGIVAGAITGTLALAGADELRERCPALVDCDPADRATEDRARRMAAGSTAAFIVGGVALGAGAAWLMVDTTVARGVTVEAGAQGVRVRGRF